MTQDSIQTGEILARDYGIILYPQPHRKVFLSPSKYALATIMLETPGQIRQRLREKAERNSLKFEDLVEELATGVKRRFGSKCFLNSHTRKVIRNPALYGATITADIKAKSRGYYHTSIVFPDSPQCGHTQMDCHCKSGYWDGVKRFEEVCTHLAALETAIAYDNKTRAPMTQNITGLPPRKRPQVVLPFTIDEHTITDIVWDYCVEGKNHAQINQELLTRAQLYSPQLVQVLTHPRSWARFGIVRQKERTYEEGNNPEPNAYYSAVKSVEAQITKLLTKRGFIREGYAREFTGTPHQVVVQRFRQGHEVYHLCIKEDLPPVLVRRFLGSRASDFYHSTDPRLDAPLQR